MNISNKCNFMHCNFSASLADTYERASKLVNLQKDVQIANYLKQEAKIYAEDEQEKIEIYNYNKQQIEKIIKKYNHILK